MNKLQFSKIDSYNETEKVELERNVIIFGPKGSGKTKFGACLEKTNNCQRICILTQVHRCSDKFSVFLKT